MTVHHSCWIVYILTEYYTSREKLDGYMIRYMHTQIYTHTKREKYTFLWVCYVKYSNKKDEKI